MKITLTSQQKQQLEQMHDATRDSRVFQRNRMKAPIFKGLSSNQYLLIYKTFLLHSSQHWVLIKDHFECFLMILYLNVARL